jgi:hypothetical protein
MNDQGQKDVLVVRDQRSVPRWVCREDWLVVIFWFPSMVVGDT